VSINTQNTLNQAQSSLRNQATHSNSDSGELKKNDFMNLFLTQVSNQNPTDPMDSGAMMTQLSQLGSMEQLENLNKQMGKLNDTQNQISGMQTLKYLEKDVLTGARNITMDKGSSKPLYYNLDQEVDSLKVLIEGKDGAPLFTEDLGLSAAGRHQFIWDGENNEGVKMPDGEYKINLMAIYPDGSSAAISTYNSGRVSQIDYMNGQPFVKINDRLVPINEIRSVDHKSQRLFGNAKPLPVIHELQPKEMVTNK